MASIADTTATGDDDHENGETRRDFLLLTAGAFGAVAVGAAVWPLVDQMNPAADTLAASTTEVKVARQTGLHYPAHQENHRRSPGGEDG
jgi:ubiquinol-cytochrome c reductase iron-sulfur subunit